MPMELHWSPRLSARFWDGLARSGIWDKRGFATLNGPAVTEFVLSWNNNNAACLDFGSGTGRLAQLLLQANVKVATYEPSVVQAEATHRRLGHFSNFLGTVGNTDCRPFDFVICTEVIEHVLSDHMGRFMSSLLRHIAPGGTLFLTTPHAEDMIVDAAYCPVCDHTFHRWQHQRSWQVEEIVTLMERWGLRTEWVGLVGFDDPNPVRDFNLRRRLGERWPWTAQPAGARQLPLLGRGDHITYIGIRRQNSVLLMRGADGVLPDNSSPGNGSANR